MAWNEPGGNKQDPWGNRNDKGPPDLDEIFKNMQNKISGIFGKSGNGGGGHGSGFGAGGFFVAFVLFAVLTLFTSFFTLQEPERGVVTRLGAFQRIAEPGFNFKWPWFLEEVEVINVDKNLAYSLRQQSILTKDENIVEVDVSVQYNVSDAKKFAFNVRQPNETLQQVVNSALREVVGKNDMDFVLKEGRDAIANSVMLTVQSTLDSYETGINVTNVNLEGAQPPEPVQAAFSDANKAREDKERFINEAEAYSNDIIPKARGDAQRLQEEAKAYRTRVVRSAEGDADRFLSMYTEYQKAPKVTRSRMYLDALEQVLANSSKVMVDVDGGNNMMYLPLDALLRNQNSSLPVFRSNDINSTLGATEAPVDMSGSTVNRRSREEQ